VRTQPSAAGRNRDSGRKGGQRRPIDAQQALAAHRRGDMRRIDLDDGPTPQRRRGPQGPRDRLHRQHVTTP
jgi:hypothetical protein